MVQDPFGTVLAAHREKARFATTATFGLSQIDAIERLSGGASTASIYKIKTHGRRYLLRIEGEPSPLRNPHQYAAMRIAAEAGISPKIRHLDEVARVVVIDFIDRAPLNTYPGGPRALAQALGELLSRVQKMPVFPHFINYPDIVARLFAHVCQTGLFANDLLDPYVERLELLGRAYEEGAGELVSSHNDFIPSNILFDGQRLWLIDWESAYRNDPLVDVAICLDSLVRSPDLDDVMLKAWLGQRPGNELLTRLSVVRALTRLYYAGVFLSASAAASWTTAETDLSVPTLDGFNAAVRAGVLKAGTPRTKHVLGKMYLASYMSNVATPGFDAAV